MNQLSILRRHLCILRQVQPPFLYPQKHVLLERLRQEDLEAVSERTFERDLKEIEIYYGIRVRYCRTNRGYFLEQPEDEDVSNFQQFFQLLERCDRLAFLTHTTDAQSTSKYLLLEDSYVNQSLQHLPILWEALRSQRQICFKYLAFQAEEPKQHQVEPLVLIEYRNRWYLAAWDIVSERFKTYGLERMLKPTLSDSIVKNDRRSAFLALKKDALGVFVSPEDTVERVVLKVDSQMSPYLCTVPLHSSQKVIGKSMDGTILELHLIINPELESTILSYGEHVEVLEPANLRGRLKVRIEKLLSFYN